MTSTDRHCAPLNHSLVHGPTPSGRCVRLFSFPLFILAMMATSTLHAATAGAPSEDAQPGENFQVTIEVFEVLPGSDGGEPQQKLQDRHLVIFSEGKASDFALTEPRDVTVLDTRQARVTLLSRGKQVKTTIANQEMVAAAARLKAYAKSNGKEDSLGINAKAELLADEPDGYRIEFPGFRYHASAIQPESKVQALRFAEFTDWVTRVNLIRKLGTPPFARMTLGRTIALAGKVPDVITLELKTQDHSRTFLSRYTFKTGLSEDVQKRLDEVAGMKTLYREIDLNAFPR